jgi:hypothetical protein
MFFWRLVSNDKDGYMSYQSAYEFVEGVRLADDTALLDTGISFGDKAPNGSPQDLTENERVCFSCGQTKKLIIRRSAEWKGKFCIVCKRFNVSYAPMGTCEGVFFIPDPDRRAAGEKTIFFRGVSEDEDTIRKVIPHVSVVMAAGYMATALDYALNQEPPFIFLVSGRATMKLSSISVTEDLRGFRITGDGLTYIPRMDQTPLYARKIKTKNQTPIYPSRDLFDGVVVNELRNLDRSIPEDVLDQIKSLDRGWAVNLPVVSWEEILYYLGGQALAAPEADNQNEKALAIRRSYIFDTFRDIPAIPRLHGPEHAVLDLFDKKVS